MIEISLGKLVLLALVALIVLGPEKLPHAARTAGALVRRLRSGWESVRAEVERELEIEELKRTAREAAEKADAMQKEMNKAARETREQVTSTATKVQDEVNSTVADVQKNITQNTITEPTNITESVDAPKESTHGSA
jgi:sec-independent protein translocase protein TatB